MQRNGFIAAENLFQPQNPRRGATAELMHEEVSAQSQWIFHALRHHIKCEKKKTRSGETLTRVENVLSQAIENFKIVRAAEYDPNHAAVGNDVI
eukprot:1230021-Rhodomonas_salina.1